MDCFAEARLEGDHKTEDPLKPENLVLTEDSLKTEQDSDLLDSIVSQFLRKASHP